MKTASNKMENNCFSASVYVCVLPSVTINICANAECLILDRENHQVFHNVPEMVQFYDQNLTSPALTVPCYNQV